MTANERNEALPSEHISQQREVHLPEVGPPRGEVVPFAPRKPRRGRPRKTILPATPCTDRFDVVAAAVVGIASKRREWAAAKERVRSRADRRREFSPATPKVLGYLLEKINRERGYDWHAAATIAADLGLSVRTVERAFSELRDAGTILREHVMVEGSRASKRWRTTLPWLVDASRDLESERVARTGETPAKKTGKDPTDKEGGPDKKIPGGPAKFVGQTQKENPHAREGACEGGLGEQEPSQNPRAFVRAMAEAITDGDANDPHFAAFWRLRWAHGRGVPAAAAFSDETLMETLERAQFVSGGLLHGWVEARAAGDPERAASMLAAREDIDAYIAEATQLLGLHREMKEDVNLAMSLASSSPEYQPEGETS
jgi:hypothetical protein